MPAKKLPNFIIWRIIVGFYSIVLLYGQILVLYWAHAAVDNNVITVISVLSSTSRSIAEILRRFVRERS